MAIVVIYVSGRQVLFGITRCKASP